MLKRNDYIVISIICFFFGIFLITQFFSAKNYNKVIQPENNAVLAVEVSQLTKTNADLRREVQDLTSNLETYKNASESRKQAYDLFVSDSARYDIISGGAPKTGQGVLVTIDGTLNTPQVVDLVNAIKNIGAEVIEINGKRLVLNTNLTQFAGQSHFEIKVLGNSNLLKTAMERKGGIVEQIATKDIKFNIAEEDQLSIDSGNPSQFNYARIVDDTK